MSLKKQKRDQESNQTPKLADSWPKPSGNHVKVYAQH